MYVFGSNVPIIEIIFFQFVVLTILIILQVIIVFKEYKNLKVIEKMKNSNKPITV